MTLGEVSELELFSDSLKSKVREAIVKAGQSDVGRELSAYELFIHPDELKKFWLYGVEVRFDSNMPKGVICVRKDDVMAERGIQLGDPKNRLGYPKSQLEEELTDPQMKDFLRWRRDKTFAVDEYTGELVYYTHDVQRWATGLPVFD